MSIQNQIDRIINKRNQALTKVASKGVTVPSGSTIDDLPGLIDLIDVLNTFTVTKTLTNVTTSNDDMKVIAGNSFHMDLSPNTDTFIVSVIVTMGGVNITDQVFVPGTGEKAITANGTYNASTDGLSGYEQVIVNVPSTSPSLGTKTITANGIYNASSDSLDGYSSVTVATPSATGTKQISITANGTTTEDVAAYANAEITVNVSGGSGYTLEQVLSGEALTGVITYLGTSIRSCSFGKTGITEFHAPNLTTIETGVYNGQSSKSNVFYSCSKLTTIDCPNLVLQRDFFAYNNAALTTVNLPVATYVGESSFGYCTSLKNIVLPAASTFYTSAFANCAKLEGADFGASISSGSISGLFRNNIFNGCTKLNKLVLRTSHAIYPLTNINVFNNTPFASGKAGGTLYVPQALIATYQAATNWSTILGYANNQIKSIESTATDPSAPVDLTTHYIDGTLIPTT